MKAEAKAERVWQKVCTLDEKMQILLAARIAQRLMQIHGKSIIDSGIDDLREARRTLYLVAAQGDGAIGALSRAAEAITLAFSGRMRFEITLGVDGSSRDSADRPEQLDLSGVDVAAAGTATNFTEQILRAIAAADPVNRERLRVAYPEAVAAFEQWHQSTGGKQGGRDAT